MTKVNKLSDILEEISINNGGTPTKDMVDFFKSRTDKHVARVRNNISILAKEYKSLVPRLLLAGKEHDKSKYKEPEYTPYLWLTDYFRRRGTPKEFKYGPDLKKEVDAAVQTHYHNNPHHPEFHKSPTEMSDVNILEMVADWAAMSQEHSGTEWKQNLKKWADDHVGKKWKFNKDQIDLVYKAISILGSG